MIQRPFVRLLARALLVLWLVCGVATPVHGQQTVSVLINGLQYDPSADVYILSMTITNPDDVWSVIVTVEDADGGTVVEGAGARLEPRGRANLRTELSTAGMTPGRKYKLRVQAIDVVGNFMRKPSDDPSSQDPVEATILAEKEFRYDKAQPTLVPFEIQWVEARWLEGKLAIALDVPDPDQIQKYDGFVVDEGGQPVLNLGPALFIPGELLLEDLPPGLEKQVRENPGKKYKVTVYLTTKDQQRLQDVYDFQPPASRKESFIEVAWSALKQYPVLQGGVVLIVVFVVSWLIFNKRRKGNVDLMMPIRPPIDQPEPGAQRKKQACLRLRVEMSPGRDHGTETMLTDFPAVVGRLNCDVNLEDNKVSGKHLQIIMSGGKFYLCDLDSTNGTFIRDLQLKPYVSVLLDKTTQVRLGTETYLELEPNA